MILNKTLNKIKILFIGFFFIFNACKTLNPNLSYKELMEKRSDEAKQLVFSKEDVNCDLNSKLKYETFYLHNNLWGKNRLKGNSAKLCTYQRNGQFGWEWQLPNDARGVIGYPAIQIGPGPWSNAQEKLHGFPIQLDAIKELSVAYETEMYVKHKKYNLAFDLWLSSEFQSNAETVTTEIMVWEDKFDFKSYGKKVDEIFTPFGVYEVMKGYLKNEEFGQDWQYIAFVRKENRQVGTVDLQFLLQYLVRNHGVNPEQYLTSVEFGNEIGNSSGFTLVKKFDWVLTPQRKTTNTEIYPWQYILVEILIF